MVGRTPILSAMLNRRIAFCNLIPFGYPNASWKPSTRKERRKIRRRKGAESSSSKFSQCSWFISKCEKAGFGQCDLPTCFHNDACYIHPIHSHADWGWWTRIWWEDEWIYLRLCWTDGCDCPRRINSSPKQKIRCSPIDDSRHYSDFNWTRLDTVSRTHTSCNRTSRYDVHCSR